MIKGFWAALRFLTVIPMPGNIGAEEKDLQYSLPFFPIIGLLIGAGAAGLYFLIHPFLPTTVSSVLLIAFLLMISGGFHLDGLADTADGFFSSRPRPRILEIMRDSHIGVMGVMAIFLVLAVKITAFAALSPKQAFVAAFLMPISGRVVLVIHTVIFPYARADGGLADQFFKGSTRGAAWWSITVLFAWSWFIGHLLGLLATLSAIIISLFFGLWCYKKIGGITGDTLGAACEIAEMTIALIICFNYAEILCG